MAGLVAQRKARPNCSAQLHTAATIDRIGHEEDCEWIKGQSEFGPLAAYGGSPEERGSRADLCATPKPADAAFEPPTRQNWRVSRTDVTRSWPRRHALGLWLRD